MTSVRFDAMNKMLNNFIIDLVTQGIVIFENTANCFSLSDLKIDHYSSTTYFFLAELELGNTYSWIEEEIQMFVKQNLILLITEAEILQKLMSQSHELIHANVFLLIVWHL